MNRLPPLGPIRAFEAAGRLSSIRKAASELNVTPAAVSRQVKALENYLGIRLFNRGQRAVRLTPAGEQYLSAIGVHFAAICRETGKVFEARGRRVLNIRAYTTFAMRWLIPRLSSFHAAHPNIHVQLTTSLEWVDFEREDIDAAIRLGTGTWPGVHAHPLVRNELLPVCSPAFAAGHSGLHKPRNIARETLLHSLARPDDWAYWLNAAGVSGADQYAGLKYESSVLAYQAAIEGHGIAIAQKVLVEGDLAAERLTAPCSFTLDMGSTTYYLVFPTDQPASPELTLFSEWLQSKITSV